jgi:hypothetical protein
MRPPATPTRRSRRRTSRRACRWKPAGSSPHAGTRGEIADGRAQRRSA